MHSIATADCATEHLLQESYPFSEMQSVHSIAAGDYATEHLLE